MVILVEPGAKVLQSRARVFPLSAREIISDVRRDVRRDPTYLPDSRLLPRLPPTSTLFWGPGYSLALVNGVADGTQETALRHVGVEVN